MKEYYKYTDDAKILGVIQKIKEFSMFSPADIKSFMAMGKVLEYEPGELIIRQGDLDCWVYFLLSGLLEIVRDGGVIGKVNKRGEVFGEMGIIDGSPRSTSVRASQKSVVLGVDASLLDRSEKANDAVFGYTLFKRFSEILAERLRALTEENTRLRKELARFKSAKSG